MEWVAIPFSRGLTDPGVEPGFPALQADSLPSDRYASLTLQLEKEPIDGNRLIKKTFLVHAWDILPKSGVW